MREMPNSVSTKPGPAQPDPIGHSLTSMPKPSLFREIFLLTVVAILLGVCIDASAAEVYKCVIDGKTIYSDAPCPGGKQVPSASQAAVNIQNLTDRQADTLHDCIEALGDFITHDRAGIMAEFDKRCGVYGFRVPTGSSNKAFNESHAGKLHPLLKEKYPHIPSFQRIYDGGGRLPPLFYGY